MEFLADMITCIVDFIKGAVFILSIVITVVFGIILVGILIYCFDSLLSYSLDKTISSVIVDGKEVYNGRSSNIDIHSIGENGNTKKLVIFQDKLHLHPAQWFVSNDIKVIGE